MRCLSRIDIEAIAERFIQAYMKLPEVKTTQVYRIEPELFLEKILKLDIRYLHLSYDCSLLGLTTFEQIEVNVLTGADEEERIMLDGNTVLIESELKSDNKLRGRMNFTLMHEGSHQIFKKLFPDDYGAVKNREPAVHYYKVGHEHSKQIKDWEECCSQIKIAKICPYCGHTVSYVCKGTHAYTQEKCPNCGENVTFPPISFRLAR